MRLLDLFCGAGGAAMGYHQAGFTEIIGVDIAPQPNYPFTFIQGDALRPPVDLAGFDLIHASPPCQAYSVARNTYLHKNPPALIEPVRAMLAGFPHVIENVERSPLIDPLTLCGTHFGLSVFDPDMNREMFLKRHRLFEASFFMMSPGPCHCVAHRGNIVGVYGGGGNDRTRTLKRGRTGRGGYTPKAEVRRLVMDMPWATMKEVNEAIPPAYTKFIGEQFIAQRVLEES